MAQLDRDLPSSLSKVLQHVLGGLELGLVGNVKDPLLLARIVFNLVRRVLLGNFRMARRQLMTRQRGRLKRVGDVN